MNDTILQPGPLPSFINLLFTGLKMMQDESEVSSEIKATDGEMNFEVRCLVEPRVPPTAIVQWIRNGEVNSNTHWQSDNKSLVLNFGKVQFNDAGKYECMMKLDKFIERSFQFVGEYTKHYKIGFGDDVHFQFFSYFTS